MKINELLVKSSGTNKDADLLKAGIIQHVDKILGKESSKLDREILQKKLSADFLEISNALEQMSKSELTELFEPGQSWAWKEQASYYAEAEFEVGGIPYTMMFAGDSDEPWATWNVEFEVDTMQTRAVPAEKRHRLTGTGNSAEVFSIAVDIIRAFLRDYGNMVGALEFSAKEPSRKKLYSALIKRLLPNWHAKSEGNFFIVTKPEVFSRKSITELFEPGNQWQWVNTTNTWAEARFEVDGVKYIAQITNNDDLTAHPGTWLVEFGSLTGKSSWSPVEYGITGSGNSVQVLSTMVSILRSFMSYYYDVQVLVFSADEPSRKRLYSAMINRLLPGWDTKIEGDYFVVSKPGTLVESVNRVPLSDDDFDAFGDLMSRPIPAAVASAYIQEIIDDDELTDNLEILSEQEPARDVRPLIADWFKRVMPDQLYRFIGHGKSDKDGRFSPLHGYNSESHKGTNDPLTGNAFGRL